MNALYDAITILPLSLLMVMLFGGYAGIPEGSIPGYAFCLLFSVWLILLRSMKRKHRLRSIGIVSVFLFVLHLAAGETYRQLFIEEYFWVLWIVCFSLLALTAGILMERNLWITRAVTAAMLLYCIAGTVLAWETGKAVFSLICFVLLVRLAEEIQRHWTKSGFPDRKEHIARISPFFLAIVLTVCAVPAPDAPFDWQFAKNIYHDTVSCVSRICGAFTHPSEEYGKIGFSDSGGFLPGLRGNDEEVLSITVNNRSIRSFRLVGCISGDFRGREWVFHTGNESCSRMMDTMETACAVKQYAPSSRTDYLQKADLHYETLFYNTQYIFSPAKIKLETTREKTAGIREENGSILSKKKFHYQDEYLISCYMLNYGNPHLEALLSHAQPIEEAAWNQTAIAEKVFEKEGYSFADYQQYRKDVYTNFCRSYGLSADVREILDGIQRTSASRYEAVKNLEAYLRKLEYSTDCGALPASVTDAGSFLEYFLFTSRKGYCMHFATAFVLMANEMGIPCRYVQGYNVKRDGNGNIPVKQSCAHAWPEVYFDHVGWVAFEPTPGYSVSAGWEIREEHTSEPETAAAETESEQPETAAPSEAAEPETETLHPLVFLIPSLAVIGFLLLLYIISRLLSQRKYQQMGCCDKFRYLTQQNLRFLGYLGFGMEEGETLSEFLNRVMQTDRQDIKENLGFIPLYEALLYSDREITEEEVRTAERTHHSLRELAGKSKLKYRLLLLITR